MICSYTEKEVKIKLPKDFDLNLAELILTNYESNKSMVLKPYETRVYLIKK